jgi:hypothetical protein
MASPSRVAAALGVLAAVGLASAAVRRSYVEARDFADAACLAALHYEWGQRGVLGRAANENEWRRWSESEIGDSLPAISAVAECDPAAAERWKALLQVRTRRAADGRAEAHLWLKGRPRISSPWGWLGFD